MKLYLVTESQIQRQLSLMHKKYLKFIITPTSTMRATCFAFGASDTRRASRDITVRILNKK